jgi:predicted amidophosphoribosyltransferase
MHPGDVNKDIRELVCQRVTTKKSHCSGGDRLKIHELIDVYELDIEAINSARENIVLFDDILTAGAHYHAMKTVLHRVRADLNIVGIFIARVIRPQDESLDLQPL